MSLDIFAVLAISILFASFAVLYVLNERKRLQTMVDAEKKRNHEFAMIFHQVTNFLTSVKWHSELLKDKDGGDLSIAQQQILHKVQTGVDGAIDLLQEHFVISQEKGSGIVSAEVRKD